MALSIKRVAFPGKTMVARALEVPFSKLWCIFDTPAKLRVIPGK